MMGVHAADRKRGASQERVVVNDAGVRFGAA
jgi:hypothetical protein